MFFEKSLLFIFFLTLSVFCKESIQKKDSSTGYEGYETKIFDKTFSTASKIVIDESTIRQSNAPNIGAVLASQANINITNSAFQPNSLYIRGGDASQVLILIDEIPVYDSSTIQRSFNLNSISIASVRKITVIKGSQSVWYGGQALSAVIKIDTIPMDHQKNLDTKIIAGADNYKFLGASYSGDLSDNSRWLIRGSFQGQSPLSPVLESDMRYKKRDQSKEVIFNYRDESQVIFKFSQSSDRNENPTGASFLDFKATDIEDFINTTDVDQLNFLYRNYTIPLRPSLIVGHTRTKRLFSQRINQYSATEENQSYKSTLTPVRVELRPINMLNFNWDIGFNYQKESMLYEQFDQMQADQSNEMKGIFSKFELVPFEDWMITSGFRNDSDQQFITANTYQIGINYREYSIEHSTGYRLPSLYQLYSNKGNSLLSFEYARTYTFEQKIKMNEQFEGSYTLFETHIENQIAARGNPLQYYNVGRTITKGIEAGLIFNWDESQRWIFNLAYQEPKDISSGRWLVRRPLKTGSVSYLKNEGNKTFSAELIGRSDRLDNKSSSQYITIPGYFLLNISYTQKLENSLFGEKNTSLLFRCQNILDQRYEESYGYYAPGLEFYAGASWSI